LFIYELVFHGAHLIVEFVDGVSVLLLVPGLGTDALFLFRLFHAKFGTFF
jgi:hypothetical protein